MLLSVDVNDRASQRRQIQSSFQAQPLEDLVLRTVLACEKRLQQRVWIGLGLALKVCDEPICHLGVCIWHVVGNEAPLVRLWQHPDDALRILFRNFSEAVQAIALRRLPSVGAPCKDFPDMLAEQGTDLAGIGH
ncbi:hypothetical protein D3C72_1908950 [compost metagenome]